MRKCVYLSLIMSLIAILSFLPACGGVPGAAPGQNNSGPSIQDVEGVGSVLLDITYPVGFSPKVFTTGWVFGARAVINSGKVDQQDISSQIKWSGSGTFQPANGALSRPTFSNEGDNQIQLSVLVGKTTVTKNVTVSAVSPANYAYVGCRSFCPADSHGAPDCPHSVIGPISSGSPDVLINGMPAACVGDVGSHAACCGPNTFTISAGDSNVLINGKAAARIGDVTQHCGGMGKIVAGDFVPPAPTTKAATSSGPPVISAIKGPSSITDVGPYEFSVSVSGGKPPYTVNWHSDRPIIEGVGKETVSILRDQLRWNGAGYYVWVSVRDSAGKGAQWIDEVGNSKSDFTWGLVDGKVITVPAAFPYKMTK